jgi:16S rRNA (uracil1498-N3)-methyltransferase
MRKLRLFISELAPSADTEFPLSDAMQHRLFTVLRVSAHTEIELFDGYGRSQQAIILPTKATSISAEPHNAKRSRKTKKHSFFAKTTTPPSARDEIKLQVHYGIALIKGERFDWALQKMTELGVTQITPLICDHGEVKLAGERLQKKMSQWEAILIAAAEQCHFNWLPTLNSPAPVSAWCESINTYLNSSAENSTITTQALSNVRVAPTIKKWILCPTDTSESPANAIGRHTTNTTPFQLAVCSGPEGGFSKEEISAAQAAGFESLTLGPRVLRAETAPVVALSLGQWLWGDFQKSRHAMVNKDRD